MRSLDKIIEALYDDYRINYDAEGIYNDDEALPPPSRWHLNDAWHGYGWHESRTIRLIHAVLDNASRAELITSPNKYIRDYAKKKFDEGVKE